MSPLWISKVEDTNSNENSVQINNQMDNQHYMRSMMHSTRRSGRTVGLSELTRESAAFVTFSQNSVKQSAAYSTSLAGVDETLFAAD